jgi:hypothetical protein
VFVHIPKTGGTTIESVLGHAGIRVGYCHNWDLSYKLRESFIGWERWHTPAKGTIPNSWAIVRDPYKRAESEFLYATGAYSFDDVFSKLHPGYSRANCVAFQSYIEPRVSAIAKSAKSACYKAAQFTLQGMDKCDETRLGGYALSHWGPQSVFTATALRVFKIEECFTTTEGMCPTARATDTKREQPNILSFLRKYYHRSVTLDRKYNEWHDEVEKPDLHSCWEHFSPSVLQDFNDVYAYDFEQFGYSTITPSASNLGFPIRGDEPVVTLGEIQAKLPKGQRIQDNAAPDCGPLYDEISVDSHAATASAHGSSSTTSAETSLVGTAAAVNDKNTNTNTKTNNL